MTSRRSRRPDNPFLAITVRERAVVLGAVAFLVLLVGAFNLPQGRADLALIFSASVVYLALLMMPLLLYRREWGWFHPVVFIPLWTFGTSALPSIGMFIGGLESHSALPGMAVQDLNSLVVQGLLLKALGWVMFYAGATTGRMRTVSLRFPHPGTIPPKILFVAALSFGALVVLMHTAGGLDPLLLQRGHGADPSIRGELAGHWVLLASQPLPAACLVWLGLRPTVVRSPLFWLVLGGGLFMGFAATGSRSDVLLPIVVTFVIWALRRGRIPYFHLVAIVAAALIVIGVGSEFRQTTGQVNTVWDVDIDSDATSGLTAGIQERINAATEGSALTAILGRVPNEVGLLYGRSYLSVPAAPIPSAVWPRKPEAAGQLTGHLIFGYPDDGAGIPPGTVGEAFWNFHVPGVIGVFFLWGLLANWLATFYREHAHHGGVVALYVITLVGFWPSSVSFYESFHHAAAALFALILFCGRPQLRKPRGAPHNVRSGRT